MYKYVKNNKNIKKIIKNLNKNIIILISYFIKIFI